MKLNRYVILYGDDIAALFLCAAVAYMLWRFRSGG